MITEFVDANLAHCKVKGRSVTGLLILLNQTPIEWFSKNQATVETSTYGSELVASRISVEKLQEFRYLICILGAPVDGSGYLFGEIFL